MLFKYLCQITNAVADLILFGNQQINPAVLSALMLLTLLELKLTQLIAIAYQDTSGNKPVSNVGKTAQEFLDRLGRQALKIHVFAKLTIYGIRIKTHAFAIVVQLQTLMELHFLYLYANVIWGMSGVLKKIHVLITALQDTNGEIKEWSAGGTAIT